MRAPMVYTPDQVYEIRKSVAVEIRPGKYVAARPEGWPGLCGLRRLHAAWQVFTGRWDALRWEGQP